MYRILYLTPEKYLEKDRILKLQGKHSKTYIEELVLPFLYNPRRLHELEGILTEFERIFSGLANTLYLPSDDVMGRVASIWYSFTKTSHASLGPRIGGFTENLIRYWIEQYKPNAGILTNTSVSTFLADRFRAPLRRGREKIDFIIDDYASHTLSLIELRESEHTGGRTGQESLMDKFTWILSQLEKPGVRLRELLEKNGYRRLELIIAILFAEKDHKLLSMENYNEGRFTSLRRYILDERHIGGRMKELIEEHEYALSLDGCQGYLKRDYVVEEVDQSLRKYRRVCLHKGDFTIELAILWGDEFFKRYAGKEFYKLLEDMKNVIADDIWLFFTVALNEAKILGEFGSTNLEKVYSFLEVSRNLLRDFNMLYINPSISDLEQYFRELDRLVDRCASEFLQHARKNKLELRLLETNDITKQYIYLKQLCIIALAMHKKRLYKGELYSTEG